MATTTVDVVGSSPISFTNSQGAQRTVPLSALQFSGSDIQLNSAWKNFFDPGETQTLLAVAKARAVAGELTRPPVQGPRPAVRFTASRAGTETNNISVTATPDAGSPLAATIAFTVTETDTYPGLASPTAAAMAIGLDTAPAKAGDPPQGTGLVVIKSGSVGNSTKLPVASSGVMVKATGVDIQDATNAVLFTLVPRSDYAGKGGLSYAVSIDGSGTTFTVVATYDSTKETGAQAKVTIQTLGALPSQVAYLTKASEPPGGARLPTAGSIQLSGGSAQIAANGLFYTS